MYKRQDVSNTARILDILSAAEAHATFFLVGNKAHRHTGLVREIHGRGHQIANHGFAHRNARRCTVKEIVEDVEQTQVVLEDIVGTVLKRDFRPPYGAVTPASFLALTRRGYRYVFWSIDSRDYATQSADETFANVAVLKITACNTSFQSQTTSVFDFKGEDQRDQADN